MKKFILHIVLVFISLELPAQTIQWEKLINYLPNQEVINSLDQSSDTTIVFCTTNGLNTSFAKAKLNGDTLWKKNKNVNTCYGVDRIAYFRNGELMHFGNKNVGSCSEVNFLFQKLSADGTVISSWDYGDSGVQNGLTNFAFLPEGGFLASGLRESSFDYYLSLMKLDSLGNKLWHKKYRDGASTSDVVINRKGNYLLRASAADQPFLSVYHHYFLEVNPNGDSVRSKYLIVHADSVDEDIYYAGNWGMIQNEDGDYVFTLSIDSVQTRLGTILDRYIAVVMMDTLFNIKWRLYLNKGTGGLYYPTRIIELRDSTYVFISINTQPESNQFFFYKISKTGQVLSQKTFTSSICSKVKINEIKLLADSSLIISDHIYFLGSNLIRQIISPI
ncbi:MAG: hypothetical protein K2X86_13335 [Cytophagaceae bacterium]|nr:hypothetical protein [Cytophagaceae bacterium]